MIEALEPVRIEKLKGIEALGYELYPTEYRYTHTIAEIVAAFSAKTSEELEQAPVKVRVAGRMLANRSFGKAGFFVIRCGEKLQVYAKKDQLFERLPVVPVAGYWGFQGAEGMDAHRGTYRARKGPHVLAKGPAVALVSWIDRCRNSLPPPLCRSGVNPEVRDVFGKAQLHPGVEATRRTWAHSGDANSATHWVAVAAFHPP
jgi:hypothetical protein